jgi:LPXTG-motif cell wall-anchored protein
MKKFFLSFLVFLFLNSLFLIRNSAPVYAATMSLSPATGNYALGANFNVDVIVDPATDAISAASAIVDFDKTKLTAVSVVKGPMFTMDPLTNTIGTSTDGTKGEIRFDSGSLGATGTTTRGTLATITFRTIAAGTAAVTFVFDPTLTTGTSLVAAASGPTNLLTTTMGASYTIAASGVTPTTPVMTYPPYATGTFENTVAMIAGSLLLLGSGFFLARKYFYA